MILGSGVGVFVFFIWSSFASSRWGWRYCADSDRRLLRCRPLISDRLLACRRVWFGFPPYPHLLVLGFLSLWFPAPASRLWGDLIPGSGGWNWATSHAVGPLQNILDLFEALIQHVPMVLGLVACSVSAIVELGLPCLVI